MSSLHFNAVLLSLSPQFQEEEQKEEFLHTISILCREAKLHDFSEELIDFCSKYKLVETIQVRGHGHPNAHEGMAWLWCQWALPAARFQPSCALQMLLVLEPRDKICNRLRRLAMLAFAGLRYQPESPQTLPRALCPPAHPSWHCCSQQQSPTGPLSLGSTIGVVLETKKILRLCFNSLFFLRPCSEMPSAQATLCTRVRAGGASSPSGLLLATPGVKIQSQLHFPTLVPGLQHCWLLYPQHRAWFCVPPLTL